MSERTNQLKAEWGKRSERLGFTQRAVLFKRFPGWLNDWIHGRHVRFVADSIPLDCDNVLDVGCGYGRISAELAIRLPDAHFEGIDLCTEFAEQYELNIGPCFNGAVQDYRPDKQFRLIVIVTTLMYLTSEEQDDVLCRLWSALSPGGRIICIEPASEIFNVWRSLTGKESASPTGGTVEHFLQHQLTDKFSHLDSAQIVGSESIRLLPFVSASAVHHCVAVAKRNMYDEDGRGIKAMKIVAVLKEHCGELSQLSILDVSCSTGLMPRCFAPHFSRVTGIDIDEGAVAHARECNDLANVDFKVMDALHTGFADNTFDVVVCNQVYEHVPDAEQLLQEIRRILVPGGVCYFGATNRLKVIETHYGRLPFLSFLPKPLANLYLRILGRGDRYYENLYTYWTLKRMCKSFDVTDYTVDVVRQPARFGAVDTLTPGSWQQKLALLVLRYAYWFSPGYIWLLEKPGSTSEP